ncbi:MAG: D-alanine--D-alanine ligase [Nitrospirae bacterium]|nr:D-alanine--D-alanine ligase [Nitrospirota bacterium]
MITDKRIGVLAGGTSAEREVSLKSGSAVYKALSGLGYDAVFIDVSDGVCEKLRQEGIDIAFIVLHGGHGENGAIQGLLEVMGIPYTGSGILASALAMDKEAAKMVFLHHDIPVAPYIVVRKKDVCGHDRINSQMVTALADFPLPWVVKPATEGSSIGVNIVREEGDIADALKEAFAYGDRVLVEEFIKGKEVQIAILDNRSLGGVEVRPLREFYDFEAKYTPGLTNYILPPEISELTYDVLKALALRAHTVLGCRGATRVDFIVDESNNPFLLEVNTIPGMTETSLLPKIARSAKIEFPDLIEKILASAIHGEI